ncbi:hypothetical protein FKX85_20035 [Echinicola soli]|uniref:Uncharacterized protein n=1 Tax=Echinicola soli TaxID=2591634 RepID=A0A514CNA7_9BACT|nr:hypothetical protein [Echinicola soli]QDH81194.1 hypothetical protein FKX85_20035 [Echinicola soli]
MIGWIINNPEFWWATVGLLLLYYGIVLTLLFGPAYFLGKRWAGKGANEKVFHGLSQEETLCRAFREYARIHAGLDRPRFKAGKLLIPSHIHLDMLSKAPFCRVVERENAKPSQHDKQPTQ